MNGNGWQRGKWYTASGNRARLVLALLGLIVILSFSPAFLSVNNFSTSSAEFCQLIIAMGMTVVIISGIDLSVGSVLALVSDHGAALQQARCPILSIFSARAWVLGMIYQRLYHQRGDS